MADRSGPGYGTPNWEMLGRWLELDRQDDGPFWALNLMKYRAIADYGGGSDTQISGREADDAYAPLGPLAAIGALVAFHGDVLDQPLGEPRWDRVGIVRYPSRAAFFAMQKRDDFKEQHVHKEAGMDVTIVMSCLPRGEAVPDGRGALVLVVDQGTPTPQLVGIHDVVTFTVEGVIVGDERTFRSARFVRASDDVALAGLVDAMSSDEAFVMVVDPAIDRLVESIADAPVGTGG